MDKGLIEVKEKLTSELTEYARIKDITNANLDVIYKTVKSIYYLTTIEAMTEHKTERVQMHEPKERIIKEMEKMMQEMDADEKSLMQECIDWMHK